MRYDLKTNIQRFQYAVSRDSQARRKKLHDDKRDFTIVSNDCWGAEVYKDFGVEFLTPFIGLYIAGPCFTKLAIDFKRIVQSPLRFTNRSAYDFVNNELQSGKPHPTGLLDDGVEIHFLHYASESEAASKWARRVERINYNRLFFKVSADGNLPFSDEELRVFDELPAPRKLILTKRHRPDLNSALMIPDYNADGKLMYEISLRYFDIADWLNAD